MAGARVSYRAWQVGFTVVLDDAGWLPWLADSLPYGSEPSPDEAVVFTLRAQGLGFRVDTPAVCRAEGHIAETLFPTLDDAMAELHRALMVWVASQAPRHIFLHAGVVAVAGRALVLPGASFAGKTTLTAALVRAGAEYCSDEYAVLDSGGRVHPYPRALQMREPGGTEQRPVEAAVLLGGATRVAPLRAALVVFARYVPGSAWQPRPVSPGMAALECLRHAIPVQRAPARTLAALAAMLQPAPAWQVERAEADVAAQKLLTAMHDGFGTDDR